MHRGECIPGCNSHFLSHFRILENAIVLINDSGHLVLCAIVPVPVLFFVLQCLNSELILHSSCQLLMFRSESTS